MFRECKHFFVQKFELTKHKISTVFEIKKRTHSDKKYAVVRLV